MKADHSSFRLTNPRPPRVHITYEVETYGVLERREVPFVVGVLADLMPSGVMAAQRLRDRRLIEIDIANFDAVMEQFAPEIRLEVPNYLMVSSSIRLKFTSIASFVPAEIVGQVEPLQKVLELRQGLASLRAQMVADWRLEERVDQASREAPLAKVLVEFAVRDSPGADVERMTALLNSVLFATVGDGAPGIDATELLEQFVGTIDISLSRQLSVIMHNPVFQRLEAAWRGLHYLVNETETSGMLKIKLLQASKKELFDDLPALDELDGGEPFGLLMGDYEFGPGFEDVALLERLSAMAAVVHAPFISAASPAMFGVSSFSGLAGQRDLASIFNDYQYGPWNAFRKTDNAKYVGLCLPHFLLRLPYGTEAEVEQFNFHEMVDGRTEAKYLWGNTAYLLAARFTDSFRKHQWFAAVRGMESGGRVERLPTTAIHTGDGRVEGPSSTDIVISERHEVACHQLGFISLLPYKGSDMAVFLSVQSVHETRQYLEDIANVNARLAAQLPYIMAVSRFAQVMKLIIRNRPGAYLSRQDCETLLNNWISQYVLADDSARSGAKAEFPLREARVEVSEVAGKPGAFVANAYLRPRFQLDEMTVPMRVVVRLH